jgi:hypothetical protein
LFAFIAIDAVANRWHYLVDLPVGVLLAAACAWAAIRLNQPNRAEPLARADQPDRLSGLIGRLARNLRGVATP